MGSRSLSSKSSSRTTKEDLGIITSRACISPTCNAPTTMFRTSKSINWRSAAPLRTLTRSLRLAGSSEKKSLSLSIRLLRGLSTASESSADLISCSVVSLIRSKNQTWHYCICKMHSKCKQIQILTSRLVPNFRPVIRRDY